MKRLAALAGLIASAFTAGLLIVLSGNAVSERISDCAPPRFLMERDLLKLRYAVDAHLEETLTSPSPPYKVKDLGRFDWQVLEVQEQTPAKIRARVILGEEWTAFGPMKGSTFYLDVRRECANGDWRVHRLFEDRAAGPAEPALPLPG